MADKKGILNWKLVEMTHALLFQVNSQGQLVTDFFAEEEAYASSRGLVIRSGGNNGFAEFKDSRNTLYLWPPNVKNSVKDRIDTTRFANQICVLGKSEVVNESLKEFVDFLKNRKPKIPTVESGRKHLFKVS